MILSEVVELVTSVVKSTVKVRLNSDALNDMERFVYTWASVMALEKFETRLGNYRLDEYQVANQFSGSIMPRFVGLYADDKFGLVNLLNTKFLAHKKIVDGKEVEEKLNPEKLMNPIDFMNFQAKLLSYYKKEAAFGSATLEDANSLTVADAVASLAIITNGKAFSMHKYVMCIPLVEHVGCMIEDDNVNWLTSEKSAIHGYVYGIIQKVLS